MMSMMMVLTLKIVITTVWSVVCSQHRERCERCGDGKVAKN